MPAELKTTTREAPQCSRAPPIPRSGDWKYGARFELIWSRLDRLKAAVGKALPGVKHSWRIEAMARGLGWRTFASMRADLFDRTVIRAVDDVAFRGFLTERGHPDVNPSVLEAAVRLVMDEAPPQDLEEAGHDQAANDAEVEDDSVATDFFFRR